MSPSDQASSPEVPARDWAELGDAEQTRLLIAYGRYLDALPPTCSLEAKIERFQRWLAERGIAYQG
ncbi:MAG: hypothetical protein ACM3ST_04655 [Bdellovibrio bacteriovorus]